MRRFGIAVAAIAALASALLGCGNGGCTPSADGCTGETICVSGICEPAFDRVYSITDVRIDAPTTDDTGAPWDALGGSPDLFIVVRVNGAAVATSLTQDDVFTASFPGPYDVTLTASSTLSIEVWDEDVAANDLMTSCGSTHDADLLRGRSLVCHPSTLSPITVRFEIDPR